jgi:hypothetical protein
MGKTYHADRKNLQFTQYAPPKSDKSCRLMLRALTLGRGFSGLLHSPMPPKRQRIALHNKV